jgi:hypothetical protein
LAIEEAFRSVMPEIIPCHPERRGASLGEASTQSKDLYSSKRRLVSPSDEQPSTLYLIASR